MGLFEKLKPGKYTNRAGKHITIDCDGAWSVDPSILLESSEVRQQIDGMDRLFKQQTIMALRLGTEPPHMLGMGTSTKKSLLRDWDDDWQAALEECNKHVDITYNSFFDILEGRIFPADTTSHMKPATLEAMMQDSAINESKEHPPVTDFFTADEIVRQYGET